MSTSIRSLTMISAVAASFVGFQAAMAQSPGSSPMPAASSPIIAMIALEEPNTPVASDLWSRMKSDFPDLPQATDPTTDDGMISCSLSDEILAIALMPAPIPWSDLEGACATAWWWPDATKSLKDHKAHLIVTVVGGKGDPIQRTMRLSKVIASVLAVTPDATGVYWGAGTVVHSPEDWSELTKTMTRELLPLRLWIDFRAGRSEDGGTMMFTTGMKTFGLMEIEVISSMETFEYVYDHVVSAAHYLLDNGPILKDGQTFGFSAKEKIRVLHRPSIVGRNETVIQLEM